jgi:hypothetical protein
MMTYLKVTGMKIFLFCTIIIVFLITYITFSWSEEPDNQLYLNDRLEDQILPNPILTVEDSNIESSKILVDSKNEDVIYDLMEVVKAVVISDFFVKNNELFLVVMGGEKYIYRIELSEKEIVSYSEFGERGKGPGEFSLPNYFGINKQNDPIIIFDQRNRRISFLDTQEDGFTIAEEYATDLDLGKFTLDNGIIYANADFFDDRSISMLEPKQGNSYLQIGAFNNAVFTTENSKFTPEVLVHLNRSSMAVHPEKEYLVKAHLYTPIIQIFNSNRGLIKEINTDEDFLLSYRIEFDTRENINRFLRTKETKYAYLSVAASNDKIYALYSDRSEASTDSDIERTLGNILHIFDWDGKLIDVLQLNTAVNRIHYDTYSQKLFGINMYDNFSLVKFGQIK